MKDGLKVHLKIYSQLKNNEQINCKMEKKGNRSQNLIETKEMACKKKRKSFSKIGISCDFVQFFFFF